MFLRERFQLLRALVWILLTVCAGSCQGSVQNEGPVKVQLRNLLVRSTSIEADLNVTNDGEKSVYIVADTIRVDGSNGPYFSTRATDSSILEIQIRMFPGPNYDLYSNSTSAKLKLLEPGANFAQHITILRPIRRTEPPFEFGQSGKRIDESRLLYLQAIVGVFPASKEIETFVKRKFRPRVLTGQDLVQNGDSAIQLYKFQQIHCSNLLRLGSDF